MTLFTHLQVQELLQFLEQQLVLQIMKFRIWLLQVVVELVIEVVAQVKLVAEVEQVVLEKQNLQLLLTQLVL
ncbi:MAG: hypothetical protein CME98_16495 [Hyphomonas sp.]|nr:hypothetical protein [Hyphomonas sp.]